MPGNFDKMITDASGKFHDISKGAFDTFGMKHGGSFDPDFASLLKVSFADGVKNILGKAGFTGEQLETFGTTSFIESIKEVATGVGAELASTAAGTAMGGPIGAAFGFAVEAGQLIHKLDQHGSFDPDSSYGRGQWVIIDNGLSVMTKRMHNVLDMLDADWDRRRRLVLSGDQPDIQAGSGELVGIKAEDSLSIGFYVGPAEEGEKVMVFNLLKCLDEEKLRTEVKPLGQNHATSLDNNEVWSKIRLLRFEEEMEGTYLDSEVNTDPGSEVLHNGVAFHVVSSNGPTIVIEADNGARHKVDISELTPGRRYHTNSHNYQGGKVTGSFNSGEKALLTVGDYIWVKPSNHINMQYTNIKKMLACVHLLDGVDVIFYYAVDGMQQRDKIKAKHIRGVSDEFGEYLGGVKEFILFKDAAVRGYDTERLAAGKDAMLTLVCLGFTSSGKTEKLIVHKKQHEGDKPPFLSKPLEKLQDNVGKVGDGGLKDRLDDAEETVKKGGNPKVKDLAPKKETEEKGDSTGEGSSSGTGLMMLGIIGAGVAFYFISQN